MKKNKIEKIWVNGQGFNSHKIFFDYGDIVYVYNFTRKITL